MSFFAFFWLLVATLITILWLVIGWRAMRAHERLASSAERYVEDLRRRDEGMGASFQGETASQHRRYKQFLRENPVLGSLSSKERHQRFREWLRIRGHPEDEA